MAISMQFKPRRKASAKEGGFEIEGKAFSDFTTLAIDRARSRPRYFDGRFLTGQDLARDQDYVRQRQDDLAKATGIGVIAGLSVTKSGGTELTIATGFGVTENGDLVSIENELKISIADIATIEKLDASFGIRIEPALPFQKRSGLFVVALRPVEYSANPIVAYPTTITGQRRVQDGDIIEATAVTLIPFSSGGDPQHLRASAARQIFLNRTSEGQPVDALPLAMIELNQGNIKWIDVNLVRRENAETTQLQRALGVRPRALAEAHILQYQGHLQTLNEGGVAAFSAASEFSLLPPVGQMPLACLMHDGFGFTESFFPPGMAIDVSFIPTDEIAALVEESLPLAPIDLFADAADLAGTGVVILIPLPRSEMKNAIDSFASGLNNNPPPVFRRGPWLENLGLLNSILVRPALPLLDVEATTWQKYQAMAKDLGNGFVWFAHRRSVAHRSSLEGVAQIAEMPSNKLFAERSGMPTPPPPPAVPAPAPSDTTPISAPSAPAPTPAPPQPLPPILEPQRNLDPALEARTGSRFEHLIPIDGSRIPLKPIHR